ncbi:MAG: hypothetical protein AAF517_06930, partial [Planctomycetota bacterium]
VVSDGIAAHTKLSGNALRTAIAKYAGCDHITGLISSVVPNFRLFWVGDLFYARGAEISSVYLLEAFGYGAMYGMFYLAVGTWALSRKSL